MGLTKGMRHWPSGILIGLISICRLVLIFLAKSDRHQNLKQRVPKGSKDMTIFNYSAQNGALTKFHFELVASSGLFTGTKLKLGTQFEHTGFDKK